MNLPELPMRPLNNVRKRSIVNSRTIPDIQTPDDQFPPIRDDEQVPLTETLTERLLDKYNERRLSNLWGLADIGSVILENKGAVARDHVCIIDAIV